MKKNTINPMLLLDFYKISHRLMYPPGTQYCYSTWTPRTSRVRGVDKIVCFGFQAFVQNYLIDYFNENFFSQPKEKVVKEYSRIIKNTLQVANPDTKHIEDLHDLGYLPLTIKALPEGTRVPIKVPMMTIVNTDPRFFWLTNYIETLASCELWQASTSATLAFEYKQLMDKYALKTVGSAEFTQWQGHDFSMRGMSSLNSAISSGMGHLLSFTGTDTVPAIVAAEKLYGANVEKELIGGSVPATEHSIQCAYGDDMAYFENIITRVHPEGLVSIVSDGYDFWDVIGRVIPALKDKIMARDGKTVSRPDSGNPVLILCGDPYGKNELERKGAVEALWNIFGGTEATGSEGKKYKVLDPHIGLIYGDAITISRAEEIFERLEAKGFASTNVVLGIGSYTYQYNTRDTFGFALKSTLCVINGIEKQIFKNPKTDDGTKKSQKGKVIVYKDIGTGELKVRDGLRLDDSLYIRIGNQNHNIDLLRTIFHNGKAENIQTFAEIRERLHKPK